MATISQVLQSFDQSTFSNSMKSAGYSYPKAKIMASMPPCVFECLPTDPEHAFSATPAATGSKGNFLVQRTGRWCGAALEYRYTTSADIRDTNQPLGFTIASSTMVTCNAKVLYNQSDLASISRAQDCTPAKSWYLYRMAMRSVASGTTQDAVTLTAATASKSYNFLHWNMFDDPSNYIDLEKTATLKVEVVINLAATSGLSATLANFSCVMHTWHAHYNSDTDAILLAANRPNPEVPLMQLGNSFFTELIPITGTPTSASVIINSDNPISALYARIKYPDPANTAAESVGLSVPIKEYSLKLNGSTLQGQTSKLLGKAHHVMRGSNSGLALAGVAGAPAVAFQDDQVFKMHFGQDVLDHTYNSGVFPLVGLNRVELTLYPKTAAVVASSFIEYCVEYRNLISITAAGVPIEYVSS